MHVIRPTAPPTKATLGPTNAATTPGARPPSLLGRHHRARRQQPAVLVAKVVAIAAPMAAPTDAAQLTKLPRPIVEIVALPALLRRRLPPSLGGGSSRHTCGGLARPRLEPGSDRHSTRGGHGPPRATPSTISS